MASERVVVEVLSVLAAAYPSFNLTKETGAVYYRVLSDIPDETLQMAALDCVSKCRFFPTVSELRDAALSIRTNSTAQLSAFEAWEEVTRLIREQGHGSTPDFSHPWIGAAVRQSGGWVRLCMSENTVADRARFLEAFADAQRRNTEAERTLPQVRELALRLAAPARERLTGKTE